MILAAFVAALRLAMLAFVLLLIAGWLIARYFFRLVSSTVRLFEP